MKKFILLLSILALTLGLFATVSVTGAIVGSDNPAAGLSGGMINLYGVQDYTANTNVSGQFVVEDVLSGNSYDYMISKAGYQDATGTIIVASTSYDMGTITLNEIALAPSAITATVNDAETAVNLSWAPPPSPGNYYFSQFENDDGDWEPSSNWSDPLGDWEHTDNYDVANWSPVNTGENITPPNTAHSGIGMWGTKINTNHSNSGGFSYLRQTFDFSTFNNTQLKFWSWENVLGVFDYCQVRVNGFVVWGPSYDYINTFWRERIIDLSAYDGLSDVEVSFEMYATRSINYAGWYIDDIFIGSAGTLAYTSSATVVPAESSVLTEAEIAGLVKDKYPPNPTSKLTNSFRHPGHNPSRIPLGYKVWRLIPGQENSPDLWISLTPTMITNTTFTDPAWESFPNGFYKWAVRTIYVGDLASGAGFSNTIRKVSNDMSALSIAGDVTPTVGTPSVYTIRVKNVGTSSQAAGAYTVKIMSGTTELASVAGPAIAVNQTHNVPVNWNPTEQGSIQIYGKVVLPDDSNLTNDVTPSLTVNVMEEGLLAIEIGQGTATNTAYAPPSPYSTLHKAFREHYLYKANEFTAAGGFPGMISALAFKVHSTSACLPMPNYTIRMKLTDQETLGTTFETGEYTIVWQRPSFVPDVGWNIHILDEPFFWNGSSNLLVEIVTDLVATSPTNNALTYYTTTDFNSSLRYHSDYANGSTGTTGTTLNRRSNIRFFVVPDGVGHITGTVLGEDGSPLPNVQVNVDLRSYTAVTDAQGQFTIYNAWADDYTITFSRHGYVAQTRNFVLEEGETEEINVVMNLMARVSITGTILASDTGNGIARANINLVGYDDYSGSTSDDGSFTIPDVFAEHSYDYTIFVAGYTYTSGTINVGEVNYDMGNITLNEIAYSPNNVEAVQNTVLSAVNLTWNAADPNAIEITEGFEAATFPPAEWSQTITNTGAANPMDILPTWCSSGTVNLTGNDNIVPTEGVKQAGLWWVSSHQDEWLFTPSFVCPPDAYVSFDTYAKLGSPQGDHYYVKISSDGGNSWTVLWDASTEAEGTNHYEYPVTINFAAYSGMEVRLAFHAEDPPTNDGLWYEWFIDNIYIGNFAETVRFTRTELTTAKTALTNPDKDRSRILNGYKVWRLIEGQENDESSWTALNTEMITTLNCEDEGWDTIPNGTYRWAVKAVYTADVISTPAFSNPLVKEIVNGSIVGFVRKGNGQGIGGATVTAEGGYSTTTNNSGAYRLSVPSGLYSVTAAYAGYDSLSYEDITVAPNQNTTLNFTLNPVANEDELVSIIATALGGNYPNPFNPETTISYDIKDAGRVRLEVYNIKGQLVRSLVNQDQASGRYRVVFNGRDDKGTPLSSGIYLYRFTAGSYSSTRKMMLME